MEEAPVGGGLVARQIRGWSRDSVTRLADPGRARSRKRRHAPPRVGLGVSRAPRLGVPGERDGGRGAGDGATQRVQAGDVIRSRNAHAGRPSSNKGSEGFVFGRSSSSNVVVFATAFSVSVSVSFFSALRPRVFFFSPKSKAQKTHVVSPPAFREIVADRGTRDPHAWHAFAEGSHRLSARTRNASWHAGQKTNDALRVCLFFSESVSVATTRRRVARSGIQRPVSSSKYPVWSGSVGRQRDGPPSPNAKCAHRVT